MLTVDSALLFGRCIATIRKDAGMTQAALARLIGISRPAVTHMETGRTPPSWSAFMHLETCLHRGGEPAPTDPAVTLIDLFRKSVTALPARGFRMRLSTRPRAADDEGDVAVAQVDRVVGRCFDELCLTVVRG